jgi:hypothetical protein
MRATRREFIFGLSAGTAAFLLNGCNLSAEIRFSDVEAQSREFMEWERTIKLTPDQEALKKVALEAIPAPCCSDNSAYTCCCSCNVSRTIWGLSNYMIAKQDAAPEAVREKVTEWVAFVNPAGYSGKTCYIGGCPRPFHKDGCGGMNANHLVTK